MTAAVIPTASSSPISAPGRRSSPVPYLAPVPDCEPPFDDEVGGLTRPAFRWSPVGGTVAIGAVATGAVATGAVAGSGSSGSSGSGSGSDETTRDPAPVDTGPRAHPRPAPALADPGEPNPPIRVPRPRRSPGLNRTRKTDVLAPEPSPIPRPTTITAPDVPSWSSEADIGVRKTASEYLPPVGRAASVLARALVEVLSGQRPLAQLRVHCAPEIYAGLGERRAAGRTALPHLLTVRVCEPADGVGEISVTFRRAQRVRAMAFRVEGVDGRWRITALQLG